MTVFRRIMQLRHHSLLPARFLAQLVCPFGDRVAAFGDGTQMVLAAAGILPGLAQHGRLLREHQPELGQQAADAVDASRALGLEALAQAMDAQHALLIGGFDGNEMHLRAAGGFADGGRVVGVVLAALALHPVRGHQVSGN